MTPLDLPWRKLEDLEMDAHLDGRQLLLRLAGTADLRVSDELQLILGTVHSTAVGRGLAQVTVDLTNLEFMNSSCFKALVTWIANLQSSEESSRYRVVFRSDPQMLWQRRSLRALSCFALDLVTIEALAS